MEATFPEPSSFCFSDLIIISYAARLTFIGMHVMCDGKSGGHSGPTSVAPKGRAETHDSGIPEEYVGGSETTKGLTLRRGVLGVIISGAFVFLRLVESVCQGRGSQ